MPKQEDDAPEFVPSIVDDKYDEDGVLQDPDEKAIRAEVRNSILGKDTSPEKLASTEGQTNEDMRRMSGFAEDETSLTRRDSQNDPHVNPDTLAENINAGQQNAAEDQFGEYPDDFPMAEVLHGLGISYSAVQLMSEDDLTGLDGIGPMSAGKILAYKPK